MSKKDAEVLKAVRKANATAGNKVPEIYVQEFETALKKKHESKVLKTKAEALLIRLKKLNQREPDVKKAMELVSELTQISGSSAGSPGSSASSSHAQKIEGKTSASTKAGTQPSASKPINGVQGKSIAASPAPRSTSNPKGGDHGKVLNRFVSELILILSLEKDWFTDKTITDCSAVDKKDLEDLQKSIMSLKESKSESLRKEGNNFSKKLVALREAILKESYASPKNSVTVENDPDEKSLNVIETQLAARHNTMLEIEKDLKNLEQKLSFDNKPPATRQKDLGILKRIQENVTTLDKLVNHRLHAVQQTNDHQIEAIDKQLRQLACQEAGEKNKGNEQKPTLDSIQQTVQALEGLLKKPAQPVDKNLEGNNSNVKSYVSEIKEIEKEVDKGVYIDKDYKTIPKDAAKCLQSLRKKLQDRQIRSEKMQEEVNRLVEEMRDNKYEDGSMKRLKGLEPQEYFTNLETIRKKLKEKLALEDELDQMSKSMEKPQSQPPKAKGRKNDGDDQVTPIVIIKSHISMVEDELTTVKQKIFTLRKTALDDLEKNKPVDLRETDWKHHLGEIEKNLKDTQKNLQQIQTTHIEIAEVNSQLDAMEKRLIALYQKQDPPRKHEAQNRSPASNSDVVRSINVMVDKIEEILVNQNSELHWHEKNKRDNERKISEMWAEADQLRAEKNDLLTRLSSIAGARLLDNNPNIADLSDQNRPTKLAEKYRETYDMEWTDAYEAFEKEFKYQDEEICRVLVKILMDVYDRCTTTAKTQASGLRGYLLNPPANPNDLPKDPAEQEEPDSVRSKMITDLRKHTSDISLKNIKKVWPTDDELFRNKTIRTYRNKCIEICWYMSLQTPPVVLERPPTGKVKFDKKKYSEYTKKGTHLDFVTLPPMLLQEDGALLCKGIAQGK